MKGKLIVIEGIDGVGKETQSRMLYEEIKKNTEKCILLHFPNYDSPSSALVKMYLNGEFADNPYDVNPYATSTFYACDRCATFLKTWGKLYDDGYIVIADRYVISNLIHQGSKFKNSEDFDKFKIWLENLEYEKFKLPKPDIVLYLSMPFEESSALIRNREKKLAQNDIHEKNTNYLNQTADFAEKLSLKDGWTKIKCSEDGILRSRNDIHAQIMNEIRRILK